MSVTSTSSHDDGTADSQLILPLALLDDLAGDDNPPTTPPRSKPILPLQVDTNIANVVAVSPSRAEREALIMQLDNQAKLIELQKKALLSQAMNDGDAADDDVFVQGSQNMNPGETATSEIIRLRYELQSVQRQLNLINDVPKMSSARTVDTPWNPPAMFDEGHQQPTSSLGTLMTDDVQLSSEYTPLGGSIWRRTSIPPAGQPPQQQQQPLMGAPYKQMPSLSRSLSLSLGPAPSLPSAEGKWSVPAIGGRKRNQSSNGSTNGSGGWSPERGAADQSSSYGAVGTPLSAHSREFTPAIHSQQAQMISTASSSSTPTYMALTEPINYRHLLERSVNCNWKYIVDKIVNNNDQQASIFLQQKLKIGSAEQKYSIIEAISEQAYQLMVNRFGNFLVQRCFEHGTAEQIEGIANAIKGNVLSLAMDAFGCHVVQKALDCVDESIKSEMVMELLRRVADTVVHRYACHVWQKLFELRWDGTPPAIMSYVNRELKGMWTQVALGETGSLVVQNIFENCVEEDKRPCIEEVIENLDVIARGQWGNWVIQHMIEHGAPEDANRALDIIIFNAAAYSMDQFASKVIEKLLKCSGADVVDGYLARICDGRPERPRIPLIDIASDAHGNYLIQYILHNATKPQRDLVAAQIRKHMVSLRGSKWGSKCAWIVERYRNQTAIGSPVGGPPGSTGGVIAGSTGQLGAAVAGPHHHHHHHNGGHHNKDRRTQYNLM